MPNKKIERKLWLYVMVTMAVIATLWALVFYPQSLKKSGSEVSGSFSDFTNKISNALAIFKKTPARNAVNDTNNLDALRQRVFGDTVKRTP